jgi:hypothetical protein
MTPQNHLPAGLYADGIRSGHEELPGGASAVDADLEFAGTADDRQDTASLDIAVYVSLTRSMTCCRR